MTRKIGNLFTVILVIFTVFSVFTYVNKMPPLKVHFLPWQALLFAGYVGIPLLIMTFASHRFVVSGARLLVSFFLVLYLASLWIQLLSFSYLGHLVDLNYLATNWIAFQASLPWFVVPALLMFVVISTGAVFFSAFLQPWAMTHFRFRVAAVMFVVLSGLIAVTVVPNRSERLAWDPILALFGVGSPINFAKNSLALNEREADARENWSPSPIMDDMPNIILFMADSINTDHLSAFGYERETSPFLSRLDEVYPNVAIQAGRATCPDSICAVMTTLLSRRFVDTPTQDHFGLGRVLSELGYDVQFVLVSDHSAHFYRPYVDMLHSEADGIFDLNDTQTPFNSDTLALEGLQALPDYSDTPTFIFVFFFSAHLAGENLTEFEVFGDYLADRSYWARRTSGFDADDLRAIANHYDNKLLQLDHFMSTSWETLQNKGYTQNSAFFFLADHGEALGARGRVGHSFFEEETLRIPFIAASTNRAVALDWPNAEQIDLAPTILSMLGQRPPDLWQGVDLTGAEKGPNSYHETGMRKFHTGENCIGVFAPEWRADHALQVEACLGLEGDVRYAVTQTSGGQINGAVDWATLDGQEKAEIQGFLARNFPRSEVVRRFENGLSGPDNAHDRNE